MKNDKVKALEMEQERKIVIKKVNKDSNPNSIAVMAHNCSPSHAG